MTGGGFRVTKSRLRQAARAFRTEAAEFSGEMPHGGTAPADGGGLAIDAALAAALRAIGLMHTQLVGTVERDGDSLEDSYREYRNAEDTIGHEVTAVVDPDTARKGR